MIIDYFPAGDRNTASSRLRVFKIADELTKLGHSVCINDDRISDKDVVIVQKRIECDSILCDAKSRGIRTIYDLDDYIPGLPAHLADITTVDTPAKLELYPGAIVIPDALDIDANSPFKSIHRDHLEKVVFVANPENIYHCTNAAKACEQLKLDLTIITDLGKASWAYPYSVTGVQWSLDSVDAEIVKADLFVVPFMFQTGQWSDEWVKSKSANRLYKAYALGMPVAATLIPSYEGLVYHHATTVEEWVSTLQEMEHINIRRTDAKLGCDNAQEYRAEKVVEQWLKAMAK